MGTSIGAVVCVLSLAACSCGEDRTMADPAPERTLQVTASAYNSTVAQTDGSPGRAAWGDTLFPGLRAIAVSRDLIHMGLGQGVTVRIEGIRGEFTVLDKMDARWSKRIDIYFGKDVEAAREWGEQKVVIRWRDGGAVDSVTGRAVAAGDSLRD